MYYQEPEQNDNIQALLMQYESMAQQGTICFFEETAFDELIDHFENQEDYSKSIEIVDYALLQYAFSSHFYVRKARILSELQEPHQALELLEKADILDSRDVENAILKADILVSLDRHDEALAVLHGFRAQNPEERSDIFLALASVYEDQEKYDNMFEILKKSILNDPNNEEALDRMWLCVEMSKRFEDSIQFYQEVIDRNPYSHLAWYNLGYACYSTKKFEAALEAFEYAFLINPKFEFAYRDAIETSLESEHYDKALVFCSEYEAQFGQNSEVLTNVGECWEGKEQWDRAKHCYVGAIQLNTENADAHFRLGECYFHEQEWLSATHSYHRAIQLNNRNETYIAALGEAYFKLNMPQDAIHCLQKATELAPEQSEYWIQYASLLMDIGQAEEAMLILEESAEHCLSAEIIYCECVCLFKLGRRKEALMKLSIILDEDYEAHSILFDLYPDLSSDLEVKALVSLYVRS